ncbi:MAG: hypothetical protein V7607_2643 [Solirubrobacteraceae bacterium]
MADESSSSAAEHLNAGGPVRRLRADARRNRERVLEAAREAFADEGVSVPLDEIARRAGVGPGTVYRHFPSKEALVEAVIFGRLQRLGEEARALGTAADPGRAFFDFSARMVVEGAAKRDLVEALAGAGVREPQVAGSLVAQQLREAFGQLLQRAQHAGAVRPDVSTTDVMAVLTGASQAMRQHADDSDVADRVLAVVCDGLRPGRG